MKEVDQLLGQSSPKTLKRRAIATTVSNMAPDNQEINSTSTRSTGPSIDSTSPSLCSRYHNHSTYKTAFKTVGSILLVAIIATPFTLWIDSLNRDSSVPIDQINIAAIRFVVIGISYWLVNSVIAGSFQWLSKSAHCEGCAKVTEKAVSHAA